MAISAPGMAVSSASDLVMMEKDETGEDRLFQ